jgi:hypothetical protein
MKVLRITLLHGKDNFLFECLKLIEVYRYGEVRTVVFWTSLKLTGQLFNPEFDL